MTAPDCSDGAPVTITTPLGDSTQNWVRNQDGTISPQCNNALALHVIEDGTVVLGDLLNVDTRTVFTVSEASAADEASAAEEAPAGDEPSGVIIEAMTE